MSATLDRKRSFGTVYGVSAYAYEQDGKHFDHEGKEVVSDKKPTAQDKSEEFSDPTGPGSELITAHGDLYDLTAMDGPALHALATKLKVVVHPKTGPVKVRAALVAAFPAADDQLASQLS